MQKIGRYQIEHELGRGAMGVVFRAYDPAIGRRVAVKTIRLDQLADPQAAAQLRERLLREAQSAGILSHPNIVTIYDIAEDSANAYIFMEYVEGATLEEFARGMPVGDLLAILQQAAVGLDYAHSKGIVHRDIKPGNLMLSGPKLKITDFGVARLKKRDSTQSGGLLGTPGYMSPEQIQGGEVSGACDQYSLAVIAYEFLSGTKPFDHDNLATLLFKIAHEQPPPVPNLDFEANGILARALSKAPTARFPSCVAFIEALSLSLGHAVEEATPARPFSGDEPTILAAPPPPLPATTAPTLPPARRSFDDTPMPAPKKRAPAIIGFTVGSLVMALALWYFLEPKPKPVPVANPIEKTPAANPPAAKPSAAGDPIPPPPATVETLPASPANQTEPQAEPATPKGDSAPAVSQVSFTSTPDGAEILIDEGRQDRCPRTPCALELPAGDFKVTGRLKDFSNVNRSLRVPGTSIVHLAFEQASGMLAINTTPPAASIRLDGREILEKTPAMLKLKPGTYKVEVFKDGMPAQARDVTVSNGTVQTLTVKWN